MADCEDGVARHPHASPIRRRGRGASTSADPGHVPGLISKDGKQQAPRQGRHRGGRPDKRLREGRAVEAAAIRDRALQLASSVSDSMAHDLEVQRARRKESREVVSGTGAEHRGFASS